MSEVRTGGSARLLTRTAWLTLILALWLLGNGVAKEPIATAPQSRDVATAGRPPAHGLPPAHEPLPGAGPQRLVIKAMGVRAPIEGHGLDSLGGVEPPPYERPNSVAWYQDGPEPGSSGAAVLVGHVDTKQSPAVFYELSNIKRGEKVDVVRADGSVAEFTVESVDVVSNKHFDVDKVYGSPYGKRAELRLITCGGDYDHARHQYTANVVVSAYLTGVGGAPPGSRIGPGGGSSGNGRGGGGGNGSSGDGGDGRSSDESSEASGADA
ncbi:class F sortase [Streptomyces cinnamoneus]|uniref:class F sortase n=1 Tax=Streptomyces cinnamoneus TaxID=53446 RepID=UPI0034248798